MATTRARRVASADSYDVSASADRPGDSRLAHYAPIFDDDAELAATWIALKLDHLDAARGELILTYTPLVRYVVSRLNVTLPPSLERGDLVGFGTIGLIDAIARFDIDRGLTFQTYAVTRIRGAILDELRSLDWVPRAVRGKMHSIDRVTAEFEQQHGAEPDIDDVDDDDLDSSFFSDSMKDVEDAATRVFDVGIRTLTDEPRPPQASTTFGAGPAAPARPAGAQDPAVSAESLQNNEQARRSFILGGPARSSS